jgi:hypothetical protein
MNRSELHPVEVLLLLLVAVLALEAAWVLARAVLAPLVALLLTLAHWRAPAPPLAPLEHPLALMAAGIADALAGMPVREVRRRARAAGLPRQLSRSGRRAYLLEALVALEVAKLIAQGRVALNGSVKRSPTQAKPVAPRMACIRHGPVMIVMNLMLCHGQR